MTYVMGNICGRYEKYKELLSKCDFRSRDELYITGNIIGDGADTVKLLFDMSMRSNVFPVLGKREYALLKLARMKSRADTAQAEADELMRVLSVLELDEREALLEYISELPLYEELEACGKKYTVLHAHDGDTGLDEAPERELADISSLAARDGRIIVSGHKALSDKIVVDKNEIFMNCGESKKCPLAMLCLENGREYYA